MGPSYIYNASLIRVVDGDTVWLKVELGFHASIVVDFRLAGINAPERVGAAAAAGKAAKVFLEEQLAGKKLVVESRKTEKFGRWLGTIWCGADGGWISANAELIASGHAVPYMAAVAAKETP